MSNVRGRRICRRPRLLASEAITIGIRYAQLYFYDETRPGLPAMHECFAGQVNGLCAAAVPGFLFLVTGLRAGDVGFVVEPGWMGTPGSTVTSSSSGRSGVSEGVAAGVDAVE